MKRREFFRDGALATAGAAFTLALSNRTIRAFVSGVESSGTAEAFTPSAWIQIYEDGAVTLISHRVEMGQGIRSTLPAAIADELEANFSRIRVVQADGDVKVWGDQNTDGSESLRGHLENMRRLGATARTMLEQAAAARWGVPVTEVAARDHKVVHTKSNRSLGFGALALDAGKLPVPDKASVRLKDRKDLRYIGRNMPAVDGRDITTGKAVYGQDARVPGMLYAVIARPPVLGSKLQSVNDTAALKVSGVVRTITLDSKDGPPGFNPLGGVAVLARNTYAAMKGREALKVEWTSAANDSYDSSAYRDDLLSLAGKPARVVRKDGDVDAALATATRKVVADYYAPHLAHAMMEPPAALARIENGRCEIWACTQNPQGAREEVAKALGMKTEDVTLHVTLLGGGFGRKSKPDYVVEAALLARAAGAPVKVVWTREDDIRHGYLHTVCASHLEASLDASGKATGWLHRVAFPTIGQTFGAPAEAPSAGEMNMGVIDVPFDIPNVRCEQAGAKAHTRIGWFRSVSNVPHAFAVQSFVDELAHAAGRDPREFMLELLGSPRALKVGEVAPVRLSNYGEPMDKNPVDPGRLTTVLRMATDAAKWGRKLPKGRGLGLAAHRSFASYVATVVEVEVRPDGTVKIPDVWMAIDCGLAANPDRIRSQLEGAAVMGVSLAMWGDVSFKDGRVTQGNFNDYRVARMHESPLRTHVSIVESDMPPSGVGEPGLPPVAPALCNAIFAAVGKRVRMLPIAKQLA